MPKFLEVSDKAAARAAIEAAGAADVAEAVTEAVVEALADAETVTAAAVEAVSDAAEGLNLVQADDARLPVQGTFHGDIGGGFVDADYLATDLVVRASDGQVPDFVIDRWSSRMADTGQFVSGQIVGQLPDAHDGLLVAVTDSTDQRTWLEARKSDGGPTDWSASLIADRINAIPGPLGNLAPLAPMAEARREGGSIAAGETYTVATLTGIGTVNLMWFALAHYSIADWRSMRDMRLQVWVDGESSPSVDVDFGSLFALSDHVIGAISGMSSTSHISMGLPTTNALPNRSLTATFNYPIPYGNGCVVKVHNPSSREVMFFAQVRYQPGITSRHRLKSIHVPAATLSYIAKEDETTLLTTPAGSGWLVYFSYIGESWGDGFSARGSFLERDFDYYIDGESSPSISATGTEDVFLVGWYFSAFADTGRGSLPFMALTGFNRQPPVTSIAVVVDQLQASGGIPFTSGMRIDLTTEPACLIDHEYAFCALFYTKGDGWAEADTTPAAPTPPRNVRAFTHGDGTVLVVWDAPLLQGSSDITGYTVTPSSGSSATVDDTKRSAVLSVSGSVTFTVVATNAVGNSTASSASSAVTAAALSDDPTTFTGLAGWWRADELAGWETARPVKELTDFTGERNDLTMPIATARPVISSSTLNSLPLIDMGTGWLLATHDLTGDMTVCAVMSTPSSITNSRAVIGGTGNPILSVNSAGKLVANFGGSDVGVNTITTNTPYVVTATSGAAGNVWVNGVAGSSGAAGSTAPPGYIWINKSGSGSATGAGFRFAELLIFGGVLSSGERGTVEQYLSTKYGISL